MLQVQSMPALEAAASQDAVAPAEVTRVFVSGLPPKFTSDQLAAHFSAQFKVTDAHVIADRRIGFVGFRDSSSAQQAAKHFNKSYVRMSKISVDLARPVEISRSGGTAAPVSQRGSKFGRDDTNRKRKRSREDDGEHLRAQDTTPSTQDARNHRDDPKEEDDGTKLDHQQKTDDSDWLRGRTNRTLDLLEPDDVRIYQDEDEHDKHDQDSKAEPTPSTHREPEPETISFTKVPNARLFIRNLAFSISERDLEDHFKRFGKIQEVHLVKDARTSSSKGTAFVQFAENGQAEAALDQVDGTTFQGRLLHILPASDKRDKGLTEFDISQMPLKKQKAVRRKLDAAKQSFSWNSLYMNPDAVLSSIADRLGVAKSEILDPTSADAAVKQAHAETQLIKETKQYLASSGVNIEAFKTQRRDDRCLLLKNFPYGTTECELRALLETFGSIAKLLLPPAGTMALVQFHEALAANGALRHLAYKNVKGSVLYLEKAPQGILDQVSEAQKPETSSETPHAISGTSSTIFVKNLNFSTTTARLEEVASSLPGFISAQIKTRTDHARPGQILSMGFGFLDFRSKSQAESAVKALAGHQLDGHELVVQLSSKSNDAGEETRSKDLQRRKESKQTKIIIKNLPFQTSKKDIRSLFAQYGELKMVRVPRKFDNTARGFAFAEFVTPKEAENAMDALSSTHLLGRRLVLEFAAEESVDPEEEIKAIERKVEQQSKRIHYNNLKGPGRQKFNLENARDDELDA